MTPGVLRTERPRGPVTMRIMSEHLVDAGCVRSALARVQACAPDGAEGVDATGTIAVRLDADGLPARIVVVGHWPPRTARVELAAAVGAAYAAATAERMRRWSAAMAGSLPTRPADPPLPPVLPPARPRAIAELVGDMLDALGRAGVPSTPSARGVAADGRLVVSLSSATGLSCAADPRWASLQSPASLQFALDQALQAARADLTRPPGRLPGSTSSSPTASALCRARRNRPGIRRAARGSKSSRTTPGAVGEAGSA